MLGLVLQQHRHAVAMADAPGPVNRNQALDLAARCCEVDLKTILVIAASTVRRDRQKGIGTISLNRAAESATNRRLIVNGDHGPPAGDGRMQKWRLAGGIPFPGISLFA